LNPASPRHNAEVPARDRIVPLGFMACAGVPILVGLAFVGVIAFETIRASGDAPGSLSGLAPLLWGSLMIALGATAIAAPIGILTAIHLSEYAADRRRRVVLPILELLASIPSIVLGCLALRLTETEVSPIVAVVAVAILLLPRVAIRCEGVLARVPLDLREAAYGLGATRFEVATGVVLPAGVRGISSAILLALSRALGETMIVVLLAGPGHLTDAPVRTLTTYLVAARGSSLPGVAGSIFPAGSVLLLITLGLNFLAAWILRRESEDEL
jgi:phosphate transport system permease protein